MDSQSTYDDLPWELIVSALQGHLSPDEDLRFRQWLALSADNRQKYDRLQQLWTEGMADYVFYRAADEAKAWEALRGRLGDRIPMQEPATIAGAPGKRVQMIRQWVAVAAVFLGTIGAGWWYLSGRNAPVLYETALNEQKKISLPDGSTVVIHPQTRIRVAHDYNKAGRTVILTAGEAHFEVSHQAQQPFIVDMDAVSVKDIGTGFTVQKTKDSIKVMVSGGKVAFIKKGTGEYHELAAGSSLIFYVTEHRFGDMKATVPVDSGAGSLRFDNAPLSEVIAALQVASGKKISLTDPALGQKRLTVHLDGESFDNALKIICASLNLEYAEKNGVYILKSRNSVTSPM